MKDNLKIAWRNLWRNRRRTMITAASVFFAVFFAAVMRSYQLGSYDHMISAFIESFSGYIQVQHTEYQDNPSIDYSFIYSDSSARAISRAGNIVSVAPHLESFALASNGSQSKGVAILAVDPEKEKKFSDPEKKLVRYRITDESLNRMERSGIFPDAVIKKLQENAGRAYSSRARVELEMGLSQADAGRFIPEILKFCEVQNGYFSENDNGVILSDKLAGYLKANIGDTVILIGQGFRGVSAAGLFPVRGIIRMPSPDIDNRLVLMTLKTAQAFFDAPGRITSMAINLDNRSKKTIKKSRDEINEMLEGTGTTARTWYELNPVLYQQIQGDSQSGMAMLGILYFIIFFGIFGTVLMMVAERKREFGVLIAIGMQKRKLKRIIISEMAMLGTMGLSAGLAASAPLIIYFYYHPIILKGEIGKMMEDFGWDAVMPAAWFGPYFYRQALIVGIMVMLATIYPLRKIGKLKEIEALRS